MIKSETSLPAGDFHIPSSSKQNNFLLKNRKLDGFFHTFCCCCCFSSNTIPKINFEITIA